MSAESKPKAKSFKATPVEGYLLAYNLVSFFLWFYAFYRTVQCLYVTGGDYTQVYNYIGKDYYWIQGLATLEIIHSVFGFVRSPVMSTVSQVFSRLLLAIGVLHYFPTEDVKTHWALTTMSFAWSITEIIRYLFYASSLMHSLPDWLTWARYSLFYILYPVGASSEVLLAIQALPAIKAYNVNFYYGLIAILVYYPVGFYSLFTYMIRQNKKVLGNKSKKEN